MGLYVQYGAGYSVADGWINFDASPTLRVQRLPVVGSGLAKLSGNANAFPAGIEYGDVLRGLPVATGSVDGLYASHVLEHLSLEDMRRALRESLRVLRPGGTFRLIVPDLLHRARNYVAVAETDPSAAPEFMRSTMLGVEHRPSSALGRLRAMLGNSAHLWMWDYASMYKELETAGFIDIRRASFGDAQDPMFSRVEAADRFEKDGIVEMAVEARKPA